MSKLKDFIRSRAYRNFLLNRLERFFKSPIHFSTPIVLQIEVSNVCELRCATCARSAWDRSANRPTYIDMARLENLDFLINRASEVVLAGYGEPLLHPEFDRIRKFMASHEGLKTTLITNGLKIKEKLTDLTGLNVIVLSMDGVEKTYEAFRKTPFRKFRENLEYLLSIAKKQEIQINLVWNKTTHKQLPKVIRFLERYKLGVLNLLPEKMYHRSRYKDCIFHPECFHRLHDELSDLQRTTQVELRYPDFLSGQLQCVQPLETMFVKADGELLACCSAVFANNPYRFSLGKKILKKSNFFSFWNQKRLRMFRLAAAGVIRYPGLCMDCAFRRVAFHSLKRPLNTWEVDSE